MAVSFSDTSTETVAIADLDDYLHDADICQVNPALMKDLNFNNILVITGVLQAKKLITEVEFNHDITGEIFADVPKVDIGASVNFEFIGKNKIRMTAQTPVSFPVAVRAHRLDYDKGVFKKSVPVTDKLSTIQF
jgi:hypothetical protein